METMMQPKQTVQKNKMLNELVGQDVDHFIVIKVKRSNQAKGLVVSFKFKAEDGNDYVFCGHSLCDNKDQYSQKVAYEIAVNRAVKRFHDANYVCPHSIGKEMKKMISRMKAYYKGCKLPKWIEENETK